MGKKLISYVTVHDDEGTPHTFSPEDKLPKWAREKITNPNVWSSDDASGDSGSDSGSTDGGSGAHEVHTAREVTIPPQSGRGSGDAVWHEYAKVATAKAGLSIEIPADAKKADIIEALKGAGVPVE